MSAAAHAAKLGLPHVLLEKTDHLSDTIYKYQKGKHVMATPNQLVLRSDCSFDAGKREAILGKWDEEVAGHKINVAYNAEVKAIEGEKGAFKLTTTKGQVIAVVQPHRYTRLQSLFSDFATCFNDADTVIVAETYAAGEQPIPGADREGLVAGIKAHGHRHVIPLEGPETLAKHVASVAKPGDYVVCLGAGNITQWAYALPKELAELAR